MTILLALASGLLWGGADFVGGSASRRIPALLVVLVSQFAGLLVALVTATLAGAFTARVDYLPWATGAGLAGAIALVLYYQALAIGTMGVVAPIASLGVLVPVIIGLFVGRLPSALCLVGMVIAIVGVVGTAGPSKSAVRRPRHTASVFLAVGSAAGFGLVLYAISEGARYSVVMTMVTMRGTSVPFLIFVALLAFRPGSAGRTSLVDVRADVSTRLVGLIVICGVFDVCANLMFALSSRTGTLAVVAVLGSLYPAGTVLLARLVDGERMSPVQNAGVCAALTGVALIAVGS